MSRRAVVIGAGLGGLSTALRLSHGGWSVLVLEKNERVGGKMNLWTEKGYTFDTGPTLLTMPFVLKGLFEDLGRQLEEHLELVPVEPLCRYFFPDGSVLDASGDRAAMRTAVDRFSPGQSVHVDQFLEHGRRIYDAAAEPFLFSGFASLTLRGLLNSARYLPALSRIDAFRPLSTAVDSFFSDERLRQLFNRFATYNGSSPYLAPATLAIIPYVEFAMGGWYIRGGMYRLAQVLETLAVEQGVQIRTGCEVSEIIVRNSTASGVRTSAGDAIDADIVVCNADAVFAHRELLGRQNARLRRRYARVEPSLGGFVLLVGLKKNFAGLAHHNILFSEDYRAEFDALVRDLRPSRDPTVYLCLSCKTDRSHAPGGHSNMFILVNAPPLSDRVDWENEKAAYRDIVFEKLARHGIRDLSGTIELERILTPLDFERTYNAFRGSIYGTSSNSRMAAFMRPANRSRSVGRLYFVGGSSHPGGGIPLVLLSARIVTELVRQDFGARGTS